MEPSAGRRATHKPELDLSRPRRGSRERHVGRAARARRLRGPPRPLRRARTRAPGPRGGAAASATPLPAPVRGAPAPRVSVALSPGLPPHSGRPRHALREPTHLSRRARPLGEAPPAWPPSAPAAHWFERPPPQEAPQRRRGASRQSLAIGCRCTNL
ncbi:atherin-like [Chionomys nivalis]|uniref:atherin-like n=1 Tax=Chionomys nivalis TaxID=269649 RepID=UPI002599614E|nr:atherin-like [Chionomys nivalis]